MKPSRSMLPVLALAVAILAGCSTVIVRPADFVAESEDKAIAMLGDDINSLSVQLLNKKVALFHFTTLDWKTIAAGKRISDRLGDYLAKKGKLVMLSRAEMERLFRNEVAEREGMYDPEALHQHGGTLPVDAIIYGTVDNAGAAMELMVRVMDVKTGKRLLLTGVRMPSTGEIAEKTSEDMLILNRKSPDRVIELNKTYYMLKWMMAKQPLVFMLVVLSDKELRSLESGKTVLGEKLRVREDRYKRERPEIMQKIASLKDGFSLIRRYAPQRLEEITRLKKEFLAKAGR